MRSGPIQISPSPGSVIYFASATVFAEKIIVKSRKIQLTEAHRGYMATLDNGRLIVDRKWYSK